MPIQNFHKAKDIRRGKREQEMGAAQLQRFLCYETSEENHSLFDPT